MSYLPLFCDIYNIPISARSENLKIKPEIETYLRHSAIFIYIYFIINYLQNYFLLQIKFSDNTFCFSFCVIYMAVLIHCLRCCFVSGLWLRLKKPLCLKKMPCGHGLKNLNCSLYTICSNQYLYCSLYTIFHSFPVVDWFCLFI